MIGGGIAGLTAAYLLSRRYDVTLFERQSRLGGNAYSFQAKSGDKPDIAVAAFGMAGYPMFYALLSQLGLSTSICPNSYMSMHDMDSGAGLYLTPSLKAGVTQGFDMLRLGSLKSIMSLFLGMKKAHQLLAKDRVGDQTFGELIAGISQLRGDARTILLCALCLMSSMSADEVLATPATFFLEKLKIHHDVISPKAVYSVRCVTGGTQTYVNALASGINQGVRLNARIKKVVRSFDGVSLVMEDGTMAGYDHVVMACNADQALNLLAEPTAEERPILGAWRYKDGQVVVHKDHGSFPARDLIQAYTFLYKKSAGKFNTSVNGAVWHEPHVSSEADYISSQHPNFPIRDRLIELDTTLRTPVFDRESCASRKLLPTLNGKLRTYYCGSHFGYGLHEDAVASAVAVAEHLGVSFETTRPGTVTGIQRFLRKTPIFSGAS